MRRTRPADRNTNVFAVKADKPVILHSSTKTSFSAGQRRYSARERGSERGIARQKERLESVAWVWLRNNTIHSALSLALSTILPTQNTFQLVGNNRYFSREGERSGECERARLWVFELLLRKDHVGAAHVFGIHSTVRRRRDRKSRADRYDCSCLTALTGIELGAELT